MPRGTQNFSLFFLKDSSTGLSYLRALMVRLASATLDPIFGFESSSRFPLAADAGLFFSCCETLRDRLIGDALSISMAEISLIMSLIVLGCLKKSDATD